MVVGFNHNFLYKGEVYHVQTEDGGLKSPNIVTLLYKGGTILGSRKTSYADITKVDNLEQVVEELMKEQHKEMLRKLKSGDFDEIIAGRRPGGQTPQAQPSVAASVQKPAPPAPAPEPVAAQPAPPVTAPAVARVAVSPPVPPENQKPQADLGLDEIILSYLVGDEK